MRSCRRAWQTAQSYKHIKSSMFCSLFLKLPQTNDKYLLTVYLKRGKEFFYWFLDDLYIVTQCSIIFMSYFFYYLYYMHFLYALILEYQASIEKIDRIFNIQIRLSFVGNNVPKRCELECDIVLWYFYAFSVIVLIFVELNLLSANDLEQVKYRNQHLSKNIHFNWCATVVP